MSSVYTCTDVLSKYNHVTTAYKRYINSYETDLKAAMAFYTTPSSTYLSVLKHWLVFDHAYMWYQDKCINTLIWFTIYENIRRLVWSKAHKRFVVCTLLLN